MRREMCIWKMFTFSTTTSSSASYQCWQNYEVTFFYICYVRKTENWLTLTCIRAHTFIDTHSQIHTNENSAPGQLILNGISSVKGEEPPLATAMLAYSCRTPQNNSNTLSMYIIPLLLARYLSCVADGLLSPLITAIRRELSRFPSSFK